MDPPWRLIAHNKRVVDGWLALCAKVPESALRCYRYLSADAMRRYPRRCFPLRGDRYRGVWEYEVSSGDRLFYIPNAETKVAIVYYAGSHISPAPTAPRQIDNSA